MQKTKSPRKKSLSSKQLEKLILEALDDLKAQNVVSLKVTHLTDIADYMVIATGTSNRHVKALADNIFSVMKARGQYCTMEGFETAEWILVDVGDVIVHIMLPAARTFYDLERLWNIKPERAKKLVNG